MKSVKEELEEFKKSLAEKVPKGFNPSEYGAKASDLLPKEINDCLNPLPEKNYEKEFLEIKKEARKELELIFKIYTKNEKVLKNELIKNQMEIDSDLAGRLKQLIIVEQAKMHELMKQMDAFPMEVTFHAILVKVQERLSDAITTYDSFLKKCGLNYKKIMEEILFHYETENDNQNDSILDDGKASSSKTLFNNKELNALVAELLKNREPK